jgi:hypothetical protein
MTEQIIEFLNQIGISVHRQSIEGETALPGIRIESGALIVDEERLTYPCDLLHEAGHLAVAPSELRVKMSDNQVATDQPDEVSEVYAIAWSYAAAVKLGIEPDQLFHEGGYHGHSKGLQLNFTLGVYLGVNGLEEYGLAVGKQRATAMGVEPYPHMIAWVRS